MTGAILLEAIMTKAQATGLKSEAAKTVNDKCAYCGVDIPAGKGVTAGDGNQANHPHITVRCCSWRHLHWYLVDTFTTGKHIERGMAQ
jgi:hypothetical protein